MTLICPTSGFVGTRPTGYCPNYIIKDQSNKNADTSTFCGSSSRNDRLLINRIQNFNISISLDDVSMCTTQDEQQPQPQTRRRSCGLLGSRDSMMQVPRSILKKSMSADAASIATLRETLWSSNNRLSASISDTNLSQQEKQQDINCLVTGREDELLLRSQSKNVTFADDNNLSLVKIHNFVPSTECLDQWHFSTAFHQAHFKSDNLVRNRQPLALRPVKCVRKPAELLLCFNEPCDSVDFKERFHRQCVALERCATRDRTLTGIILVQNLEYQKYVGVRYTVDGWKTSDEVEACYVPNSNDGDTDRFSFTLSLPRTYKEMEFAVRYKAGDSSEYWDNNFNRNYKVKDALSPL